MEFTQLRPKHIQEAAEIFTKSFKRQREATPVLPERMEDVLLISGAIDKRLQSTSGVAAIENERLVGYLTWFILDDFRGSPRKAAYVPVWACGAVEERKREILRGLYRYASGLWTQEGCQTHAVTILAYDETAAYAWFWNGFGLAVVDAIRGMDEIPLEKPTGFIIRKATENDIAELVLIEREHWHHYEKPPVLMFANTGRNSAEFSEFLSQEVNSIWIAASGSELTSYMVFESSSEGATPVVGSETTIAITGAFTKPEFRGKGAAPALLNASLQEYRQKGYTRCSVDFESFNPEAAGFWTKYFQPVCYSVMRNPEKLI
ncbi:MAG: GNAT family N-acetyltransferase [Chloroflexi bacterium]|nr:MAG: GNAT family N-acetyltransferase [Chloroflexota bacterium]